MPYLLICEQRRRHTGQTTSEYPAWHTNAPVLRDIDATLVIIERKQSIRNVAVTTLPPLFARAEQRRQRGEHHRNDCRSSARLALTASVPMITKGGINSISRSLAIEYAKQGIRVNAVAPGVVATPLLASVPEDFLRSLSPMGQVVSTSKDIAEAVFYHRTQAGYRGDTACRLAACTLASGEENIMNTSADRPIEN